jgi:hypothetical protein
LLTFLVCLLQRWFRVRTIVLPFGPCHFLLAQKRGIKREFDEPALCVSKKGHLRQIEDSTKSMLLPTRLTPTSLAQEANAPCQPNTIRVKFHFLCSNQARALHIAYTYQLTGIYALIDKQ